MTGTRQRVLSGMRPTGKVHLGNHLGALEHWVRMQDDYDCFYFVANWHALTTDPGHSVQAPANTIEMAADWLGAGLDPERSTLFIQSLVPEHAELHLLFSMTTPVGWLERVPTYKEMVEELGLESPSYGLLGYPLLQSADILMYRPQWVPVGVDQVPHVELTREVARRFNSTWRPVFPEPQAKLTQIPKVPGTDGRKMSKSYDNAIYLSDPHYGATPVPRDGNIRPATIRKTVSPLIVTKRTVPRPAENGRGVIGQFACGKSQGTQAEHTEHQPAGQIGQSQPWRSATWNVTTTRAKPLLSTRSAAAAFLLSTHGGIGLRLGSHV